MQPAPTVGYIILHLSDPEQSHQGFTLVFAIVFYGFSMHSQLQSGTTKVVPLSRRLFFCSVTPLGLVHFLYYLFLMSFNYEYNSGRGWRFTGPATQLLS